MSGAGTIETLLVEEFIMTTLRNDATLRALLPGSTVERPRIASPIAPSDWGNGPFVTFDALAPTRDVRGVGAVRIMGTGVYVVKAVARTSSWALLRPVAERIDQLLEASSGAATGGNILHIVREDVHRMVETEDGDAQWRHLGGEYRVWAQ